MSSDFYREQNSLFLDHIHGTEKLFFIRDALRGIQSQDQEDPRQDLNPGP